MDTMSGDYRDREVPSYYSDSHPQSNLDSLPKEVEAPEDDSRAAQKVFSVPELLEDILRRLDLKDIMSCYEVSREFRDNIDRSTQLQKQLYLLADPASPCTVNPTSSQSFSCSIKGRNASRRENRIVIVDFFTPTLTAQILPKIGSRWKRMLVCQPPIFELYGWYEGCTLHTPSRKITNRDGITIGDLYHTAETLITKHLDCTESHATRTCDGTKQWRVRFDSEASKPLSESEKEQELRRFIPWPEFIELREKVRAVQRQQRARRDNKISQHQD